MDTDYYKKERFKDTVMVYIKEKDFIIMVKNWIKLKTFEDFDPRIDLKKPTVLVTETKKTLEEFQKLFESVKEQDLSKKEMRDLGIEHGKAFVEAGNEFENAKIYSETHDMCYIDGFRSAYGHTKVGEPDLMSDPMKK